jgi:hypothetical protein
MGDKTKSALPIAEESSVEVPVVWRDDVRPLVRHILLGSCLPSKTALVRRYDKNIVESSGLKTIGSDFQTKGIEGSGRRIQSQIVDSANKFGTIIG